MIRNAKDLSADEKAVLESLLGRRILADEAISVRTIQPPALSDEVRQEQCEQMRNYFASVDARRTPGSAEEAEEILTEAIKSTRPTYRPTSKIVLDTTILVRAHERSLCNVSSTMRRFSATECHLRGDVPAPILLPGP